MKYTVIIEKGRESGYVAHCPALKGGVSQGADKEQAVDNSREAITAYVEALMEDGLPVPTEVGREMVDVEINGAGPGCLGSLSGAEVVRALQRAGFYRRRHRGSYIVMRPSIHGVNLL